MILKYLFQLYIVISFTEWTLHKYIMHGNISMLKKIPFIGNYLVKIRTCHKIHHLSVKKDMSLHNENTTNLFFPWKITFIFSVLVYIQLLLLNNFNSVILLYFLSSFSVLIFSFLWNCLHIAMHKSNLQIDIYKGVPNLFFFRKPFFKDISPYSSLFC